MKNKLQGIIDRYNQLTELLTQQEIITNKDQFKNISKEHNSLIEIHQLAQEYLKKNKELQENKELLKSDDDELVDIVKEEIAILKKNINELENQIKILLLPKDENDDKNIIIEIRGGTGGEEAALFASDLYRMYIRFSENNNWNSEIMNINGSETGGIKEAIISIQGKGVYGEMKFESGVHRVQRIPVTESGGRVHTSAATVAVLPEAEDVDVIINDEDIKIDTYRASGAGGQHVNKTESAIRITHLPSKIVVTCQDEKSQYKNKEKAMKVLRSRIFEVKQKEQQSKIADQRKTMVSTGDRSAKIRTYNFPQGRVTDHRINLTLYKLEEVLNGNLNELHESLKLEERKQQLLSV
tara:strand:+ start:296 stop:1357 length:1062 start_codon:yes stop_codon:yes gene_type:complete